MLTKLTFFKIFHSRPIYIFPLIYIHNHNEKRAAEIKNPHCLRNFKPKTNLTTLCASPCVAL